MTDAQDVAGRRAGRWLVSPAGGPADGARLYCFGHAGSAPGEYARWTPASLRCIALQLPGHGARALEAPLRRMDEAVRQIVEHVSFEPPFAFFGHSLGALMAFEVARELHAAGMPAPMHLFVSSAPAPPRIDTVQDVHTLDDDALQAWIEGRWGPLPDMIRQNPALLRQSLSVLRADLEIFVTYRPTEHAPLDCPITALAGDAEQFDMPAWRAHTTAPFAHHSLPGGHFYFRQTLPRLFGILTEAISMRTTLS
ncbi:thioesterase II family protein [Burkholderia sp. LMG 32019]|uniref:thioesterase II family protein n=1 Tax=Burkholderia sp. LMG 32019 TaxID=3158173 RepID=UPI003C2F3B42